MNGNRLGKDHFELTLSFSDLLKRDYDCKRTYINSRKCSSMFNFSSLFILYNNTAPSRI